MSLKLFGLGDCKTSSLGTGLRPCDLDDRGDLKGVILLNKSWFRSISTDGIISFSEEDYITAIKKGVAEPMQGSSNFSDETPENERYTSGTGVMKSIRKGKPFFNFEFTKGQNFHKIAYSKSSFARYDVALLFDKGVLFAHSHKKDKLKGFDLGMLEVSTFKNKQGSDPEKTMVSMQLLDAEQYNSRFVFIPFEKIGDLLDIKGVVNLGITLKNVTTSGFNASITSMFNTDDVILGLDDVNNYALTGDNSGKAISAVVFNAETNEYEFSSSGLTGNVQVETKSGSSSVIEDALANLFKGVSNAVPVA